MKLLLVCAGTKKEGTTNRALEEAKSAISVWGGEFEVLSLYSASIPSCSGCGWCKGGSGCVHNDLARTLAEMSRDFDAFIFFTPVHFGGASGVLKSALGRAFYSRRAHFEHKPALTVSVSRRGGNFTAIEEINRFFLFANMTVVAGNYPPILHGESALDAEEDKEGLQSIRSAVSELLWICRCIELGKKSGFFPFFNEEKIRTNYIR